MVTGCEAWKAPYRQELWWRCHQDAAVKHAGVVMLEPTTWWWQYWKAVWEVWRPSQFLAGPTSRCEAPEMRAGLNTPET